VTLLFSSSASYFAATTPQHHHHSMVKLDAEYITLETIADASFTPPMLLLLLIASGEEQDDVGNTFIPFPQLLLPEDL
jgi:hypothetical protein